MEQKYILTRTELEELIRDRIELSILENAGIDNWNGYDYAEEEFFEEGQTKESLIEESLNNYEKFF